MPRAEHFKNYAQFAEPVPGVFIDPGSAVYIVDNRGEVTSWNSDEWRDDPESVTATVNACILAATHGASAVRTNIATRGELLRNLLLRTYRTVKQ